MIESLEDLWDVECDVIFITTNGTVKKNGEAVMGRGCALEAKNRFPLLSKELGKRIVQYGNHVLYFEKYKLGTFPVKNEWFQRAELDLIKRSCQELLEFAYTFNWIKIALPRPGCGNGRLSWNVVEKVVELLDDRFIIVSKKEDLVCVKKQK